jgi:hypothetical protein
VSSEIDTRRSGDLGRGLSGRVPRPVVPSQGERRTRVQGRLGTALHGGSSRDVLGVNAVVLALLLVPLSVGLLVHVRTGFLFPPDSRYYLTMAYRDAGQTLHHSLVVQFHQTGIAAAPWYFASGDPVWLMVQPRMLYPFLSAPFVVVFGPNLGMLIVPVLSMGTTVVAVARLVQRLYGPLAALAAAGTLASTALVIGLTEALTDPLAMALVALILLNLPIGRRTQGHDLVWLALLSALLCMTRQVLPMTAGMVFGGWLWATVFPTAGRRRRIRNAWLAPAVVVAGVSLVGQLIETAVSPYDATGQMLLANHEPTLRAAIVHLPQLAWRMTTAEVSTMVHGDRFLLTLMAAPFVYLLVRATDVAVGLFLGGLAGTYVLLIANGIPSGMRYESVVLPLAVLCLGALVHRFLPDELRGGAVRGSGARGAAMSDAAAFEARPTWWQGAKWRVPGLAAASVVSLVVVVGWSATHGAASATGDVPTSPSSAAALANVGLAEPPVADHVTADVTLSSVLTESELAIEGKGNTLYDMLDWRHPVKYTPTGVGYPGWSTRAADGTAVIRFGDYVELEADKVASGLSLRGAVVPASVKILTRVTSAYGEDVTFAVLDRAGVVHHGRATVLYSIREHSDGQITELVYTS